MREIETRVVFRPLTKLDKRRIEKVLLNNKDIHNQKKKFKKKRRKDHVNINLETTIIGRVGHKTISFTPTSDLMITDIATSPY